ncbi:endonuclease/exonuclease/phosphatase family protein [Oleiharenicola sp. Vm1]|uniref:endonuclease/exonuclease/phosphatase family protein n=1 Tax=Oleiharenicola sp. Vm1 TaxID=3398393 RepID=UPI0039F5BF19
MKMRLASFNLNNLFERPRVLQLPGFSASAAKVLKDIERLTVLLESESYAGATGAEIVALLQGYGFAKTNGGNEWFDLQQARGKLFSVSKGRLALKAAGRADWLGWVDLKRENVNDRAIQNTARIVATANADVLCTVETESRPAMDRFNAQALRPAKAAYPHFLLVDGNDERGIDVGVFSRHPIRSVRSHVDDTFTGADRKPHRVFSRDCAEYEIELPGGRTLWLLANHFKSQGYGTPASNDAKRLRQTQRVREILRRFDLQKDLVVVAGDFNAAPQCASLQPLLTTPGLRDAFDSPKFAGQPRWTYHGGKQQLDYLLLSAPLFAGVAAVGIERAGLPSKGSEASAASDHAAIWAEVDL